MRVRPPFLVAPSVPFYLAAPYLLRLRWHFSLLLPLFDSFVWDEIVGNGRYTHSADYIANEILYLVHNKINYF